MTVKAVALLRPRHLSMASAQIVFLTSHELIGVLDGYPSPLATSRQEWAGRRPAVGATISAAGSPVTANLVLDVAVDGREGSADGVKVTYSQDGLQYIWHSSTALQVRTAPQRGF